MNLKSLYAHLLCIALLLGVSVVFFSPNAFEGKVLPQPDNIKARGMQAEIRQYMKTEGVAPLWTNSAFGGMPGYQILSPVKGNLAWPIYKALTLGRDYTGVFAQLFLSMLCMYLLMIALGLRWQPALFGALAYGVTSYHVDIIEAGHSTKMAALALAPGVLAGLVWLYKGRLWLGAGVMGLFLAMQIGANHVQITYYTAIVAGFWTLAMLAEQIRKGKALAWAKATALAALAGALALGANLSRLWPTYEYGKETIRGKSELTQRASKGDGLDKDYLFGWSYGVGESMTLLAPRAYGGGANELITNTRFLDLVARGGGAAERRQVARQVASVYYWGSQPFVGTAIYFGAIVCFLFLLGALLVPGAPKWWLVSGGLFAIMLAWGKNFFLNDIFYDILPMFNKFRAVSMALGLGQLCFAALAALGLQYWFNPDIAPERKRRALYISGGLTGLLCLIVAFGGGGEGPNDAMIASQLQMSADELARILAQDRADLARADALRSLGLIAVAFGLLWLGLTGRLKAAWTVLLLAAISLGDHWSVARRTLTNDKFEPYSKAMAPPAQEPYDAEIKRDPDLHYRVLDLKRGGITGNAYTSYFHKSLSGYHAAKLQRFQEVVDSFLTSDIGSNLHIVGMMNGKYIVNQNGQAIRNPEACGNAWFVSHVALVPNADAEMAALRTLNPRDSAVAQEAYAGAQLSGWTYRPDSAASIRLEKYHPDRMDYVYSAATEQVAVFSEIYYPPTKGWKCFINDQPAPDFFKVNYLLRGMRLPVGKDMRLSMRFEPRSFYVGEKISLAFSLLALLLFAAGIYSVYKWGDKGSGDSIRFEDVERGRSETSETSDKALRASAKTGKPSPKRGRS